ncbi:deoxyribonuclease IV [endosymbiont GvMRE of Glomus versiforme]|uniref:deoxyribonuclease IV n=1 Tax=endosymbiont GvMRE of Glomus versiforme TaxID=2039283 RepID=UPI001C0EEED9|nr:deoxyribonuclease IV [endosymbiont GvMRE of Glomus versiforme]
MPYKFQRNKSNSKVSFWKENINIVKYNLIIGRHCRLETPNYLLGAVREALSYEANALMIYLGAPQNSFRQPLNVLKVSEFKQELKENNVDIDNVIVHGSYLINLANTIKKETFDFSVKFLQKEIQRMEEIGLKTLVLHPGSCLTATKEEGLNQIIQGLNLVLTKNSKIRIALETMSGKKNELGTTFEQLKFIIDKVNCQEKIGVCWDTCHLYDAGYNIKDNLENVIEEFDQIIGLEKLWVIHVNDSAKPNESGRKKKDSHENIGYGEIGLQALKKIVHHPRLDGKVKILETPRKRVKENEKFLKEEIKILKEN